MKDKVAQLSGDLDGGDQGSLHVRIAVQVGSRGALQGQWASGTVALLRIIAPHGWVLGGSRREGLFGFAGGPLLHPCVPSFTTARHAYHASPVPDPPMGCAQGVEEKTRLLERELQSQIEELQEQLEVCACACVRGGWGGGSMWPSKAAVEGGVQLCQDVRSCPVFVVGFSSQYHPEGRHPPSPHPHPCALY